MRWFLVLKVIKLGNKIERMKDLLVKRFEYYKSLGDKTFEQLTDELVVTYLNQLNGPANRLKTNFPLS